MSTKVITLPRGFIALTYAGVPKVSLVAVASIVSVESAQSDTQNAKSYVTFTHGEGWDFRECCTTILYRITQALDPHGERTEQVVNIDGGGNYVVGPELPS